MKLVCIKSLAAAIVYCVFLWSPSLSEAKEAPNVVEFNINASKLSDALTALAIQADVQILFRTDSVKDLFTHPLKGTYTLEKAISILLNQTRLSFHFVSQNTIAIKEAPHPEPKAVTDSSFTIPEIITTANGNTSNCCSSQPNTGTKSFAPPEHIPKSFESINQRHFQSEGNLTLSDAFRDYSSIVVTDKSGNLSLRGLILPERSILLSGVPIITKGITDIPLNNVESIEISKGISSSLYGYGQPNGLVNLILKEPKPGNDQSISTTVGTQNSSVAMDSNHSLTDNTWVRLTAIHSREETTEGASKITNTQAAPSIKIAHNDEQFFTIGLEINQQEINGDNGVRMVESPIQEAEFLFNVIAPPTRSNTSYPYSSPSDNERLNFDSIDSYINFETPLTHSWQHKSRLFYGSATTSADQFQDTNLWLNTFMNPQFGFQPLLLTVPFSAIQNHENTLSQFANTIQSLYPVPQSSLQIEQLIQNLGELPLLTSNGIDQFIDNTLEEFSQRSDIYDVISFIYGEPLENIDHWKDGQTRFYYSRRSSEETHKRHGFESTFSNTIQWGETDHDLLLGIRYFNKDAKITTYRFYNKTLYKKGSEAIAKGDYSIGFELRRHAYSNWYFPYQPTQKTGGTLPLETALNSGLAPTTNYDLNSTLLYSTQHTSTKSLGIFLQDHIRLNHQWLLLASLGAYYYQRDVSHTSLNTFSFLTGDEIYIHTKDSPSNDILVPSFGVNYLPNENLSLYLNYGEQFDIIEGASILQKSFEPEKTIAYEGGFKWYGNNTLEIEGAYYQLTKSNWLSGDASSNGHIQHRGEFKNSGYEISAKGYLTPYINAHIYYAVSDIITETNLDSPVSLIGQPENTAGMILQYHSHTMGISGWTTSLGLQYVGPRAYDFQNLQFKLESTTLLNLSLTFKELDFTSTLSLDNVTDEDWFIGSSHRPVDHAAPNFLAPGYGQRLRLRLQWDF